MVYNHYGQRGRGRRGGRGGRGGRRDNRTQYHGDRMFQKGYVETGEPEQDARLHLMRALLSLGNVPALSDSMPDQEIRAVEAFIAQQMADTVPIFLDTASSQPSSVVVQAFWEVLLVKGHRSPFFACLVSIANRSNATIVEELVLEGGKRLNAALLQQGSMPPGHGPSANITVRLTLRFFATLATLGVLAPSSLLDALSALVSAAKGVASRAGESANHRTWQPYADFLVENVLLTLPWCGRILQEGSEGGLDGLMADAQTYMEARPCKFSRDMMPWLPTGTEEPPIVSDLAAASFLCEAYAAVLALPAAQWKLECIPQPHLVIDNAFNASAVYPFPTLSIPETAPVLQVLSEGEEATPSILHEAYPPRGIAPLLPEHLPRIPDQFAPMESIVCQEYYLHIIQCYAANGMACVEELTKGAMLPFPSIPLLVELLVSQILLPAPPLLVFGYQSLLVRLVEVIGQPLAMAFGGCIKGIFQNAEHMDILMLHRCSDLLAFFVSNNDFKWPWARWERVLEADEMSVQRRFCSKTLASLVRLCADLTYIQKDVLPNDNMKWLALIPASEQPTPPPPSGGTQGTFAAPFEDILKWLIEKVPDQQMQERVEGELVDAADGKVSVAFRQWFQVLLWRSKASPFHTEQLVDRYKSTIRALLDKVNEAEGPGAGELVLLQTADKVWACSSQRLCVTFSRLLSDGFVQLPHILEWAFSSKDEAPMIVHSDALQATAALEVLLTTFETLVNQVEATRAQVASLQNGLPQTKSELAKAAEDMTMAQQQSQEADVAEDEREAVLRKIQQLTGKEAELQQRFEFETKALEDTSATVVHQKDRLHASLKALLDHFLKSAEQVDWALVHRAVKREEGNEDAEGDTLDTAVDDRLTKQLQAVLNGLVAFTRFFLPAARAPISLLENLVQTRNVSKRIREGVQILL